MVLTCADNPPPTYTVGGMASGLSGTVVLQNNSGDDLSVTANGSFTFATGLADGATYQVSVKTNPSNQTCTLTHASGTVSGVNVADIGLSCAEKEYSISFNVYGQRGGLGVLLNGGYYVGMGNNGTYTFSGTHHHGFDYNVTIDRKPDRQECVVYHGVGTIDASSVNNIDINCTTVAFTVGGSLVTGDPAPSVVLQNNGGDDLTLTHGGSFTFVATLTNGADYNVTVKTPPTGQACSVTNGIGTIIGSDITNISVSCVDDSGSLSTNVKDLNGTLTLKVVLTHTGSDTENIYYVNGIGDTAQSLEDSLTFDTDYNASIDEHPTGQKCRFTDNSQNGTVSTSNNDAVVKLSCVDLPVPPSTIPFIATIKPYKKDAKYLFTMYGNGSYPFLYTYDCDNDGTPEGVNVTGGFTCEYDSAEERNISIIGNFPTLKGAYNDCTHRNIVSIVQWGDQHWLSMETAFFQCTNIVFDAADKPDLSHVTSMRNMFHQASHFNDPDINDWNVSTVTDMSGMFDRAQEFNQSLSNWDVSHVTTMKDMFKSALSFDQNIHDWNVSSVKDMSWMFRNARNFNQSLDDWNVSAVTTMRAMFHDAKKFNQPVGNWDVSSVKDMSWMFYSAESFDQNISDWDVGQVTQHGNFDNGSPIEGTTKEPNWP